MTYHSFKQNTHEPTVSVSLLGQLDEYLSFLHLASGSGVYMYMKPTLSSGNESPIAATPLAEENLSLIPEIIMAFTVLGLALINTIALFPKQAWKKKKDGSVPYLIRIIIK